ncbi:hypothetical protein ANO11243_035960 [Dothideomycetidae sp. 11243]|nr:hypothetical protein ANO11243_035960 [fungal sp. No.11243]
MVYTGPSDGCHLCRKRRIKCDGGRPGCQRCAIYKAKCPGYRPESDFKFIHENDSEETKIVAPRKKSTTSKAQAVKAVRKAASKGPSSPSASVSRNSSGASSASSSASPASSSTRSPFSPSTERTGSICSQNDSSWQIIAPQRYGSDTTITSRPTPAWEDWSISAFLHDWTISDSVSGFGVGFLEFLPDLYSNTSPNVDLSLALRAAALASFANQYSSPQMMAKARNAYGRSLTALNTSLRKPDDAVKDTTIATIILLQIFEHITCDDSLSMGNHDAGLRMLLDMRGDSQLDNSQGRGIARIIFGYLFSRNVNQKHETSEVMKRGAHRLGYPPEHPSRHRRPGSSGMPELLRELNPLFSQDPTNLSVKADAIRLMQDAAAFDQIYDRWMASLPEGWRPREVQIMFDHTSSKMTTVPRSGVVHVYSSPLHACYCTIFRMQYVILHKRLILMAHHIGINDWSLSPSTDYPDGYHQSIANSIAVIQQRNHEIISCAASAMGEITEHGQLAHMSAGRAVGAYYLLWPLMHITQDELALREQKEDAKRALGFIGNVLGVKRAIRTPNRPVEQGNSPRSEWSHPKDTQSSSNNTTQHGHGSPTTSIVAVGRNAQAAAS